MSTPKDSLLSHGVCEDVSHASVSGGALPFVRIPTNVPAPDEWTLVREVNMEKREPCEIWRSGVIHQLQHMKKELLKYSKILQDLEEDILSQETEQ
ncbi:hypothetical protein GBAR_LOCUS10305 [Geodia barretti]|uniref:Uncharacterized protein n=1 Tax=Geodia barretti TaxID=519541 RepID=A0AA35WJM5_GEOBA|nr:hypothetical protein GBAR_LOCUS10305 [Geodia barretti]